MDNITPKKLHDYCKSRVCQTNCDYNHICLSVFRLSSPEEAYELGKSSDEFKNLKRMISMINDGTPNDISKIGEMK